MLCEWNEIKIIKYYIILKFYNPEWCESKGFNVAWITVFVPNNKPSIPMNSLNSVG